MSHASEISVHQIRFNLQSKQWGLPRLPSLRVKGQYNEDSYIVDCFTKSISIELIIMSMARVRAIFNGLLQPHLLP